MPKGSISIHNSKTKEDWQQLLNTFSGEYNVISKIAKSLGCGTWSVRNQLKKHGIEYNGHATAMQEFKIKPPSKTELVSKYNEPGATCKSLGEYYHTSHTTVKSWLRDYGIQVKSHYIVCKERLPPIPPKETLTTLYQTHSIHDLMSMFSVSQDTITSWLLKYNIPIKLPIPFANYHVATSRKERELFEICCNASKKDTWHQHDRTLIAPKELDMCSMHYRLAIEYGSVYWHSELRGKTRSYHSQKRQLCADKGITLLTLFDTDEWDKIVSLIRYKIGSSERRESARNCAVRNLTTQEAMLFHKSEHLSGSCGGSLHLGLECDGEILQVLTMGRARFTTKTEWEIVRFTNKRGVCVRGGLSKLWTRFITQQHPTTVVTYADLRFGDGASYRNLGFELTHISTPNYRYFHTNHQDKLLSRVQFQKHKLPKLLPIFDPNKTEWENMQANGYDRIWDCGNAVYMWYNK